MACAAVISLAALGFAAPAGAAAGGTVSVPNRGTLVYTAGAGQVNDPSIDVAYGPDDTSFVHFWVTIHDRVPVTAGSGCVRPDEDDATTVRCDVFEQTLGDPGIYLDLGDRNDRWADRWSGFRRLDVHIHGGAGDDTITGGSGGEELLGDAGADRLAGGTGNDLLRGGTGNDVLYGNSGDDRLWGNSGNDKLYGGPGIDRLSGGSGRNLVRQD